MNGKGGGKGTGDNGDVSVEVGTQGDVLPDDDRGMVLPFSPITVAFRDIHYFVPLPAVSCLYLSACTRQLHSHALLRHGKTVAPPALQLFICYVPNAEASAVSIRLRVADTAPSWSCLRASLAPSAPASSRRSWVQSAPLCSISGLPYKLRARAALEVLPALAVHLLDAAAQTPPSVSSHG